MEQGVLATYGQLARTAWAYIGSGALFRLMRLRKGPVIAALYPVVVLLVQGLLALALGYGAYRAITVAGSMLADWGRFAPLLTGLGGRCRGRHRPGAPALVPAARSPTRMVPDA